MALQWSLASAVGSTSNSLIPAKAIYTGSVWVVVGSRLGSIPTATGLVWTSPDGQTWTLRTAAKGYKWKSVAFSPTLGSGSGRLVAVCDSTLTGIGGTITDQVMYSDDLGASWTSANSAEVNGWNDIVWANTLSLFVAVAGSGTHRVMTSTDGVTWNTATAAAVLSWNGIAWDGTNLVASAGNGTTTGIMTSTDGSAWTSRTTPISITFQNRGIAYSSTLGMFVVKGQSSSVCHVLRSTNGGTTWTDWSGIPASWSNTNGGQIAWGATAGAFILTPFNADDHVLTSPDGNVWTRVQLTDAGGDNFARGWDAIASDGATFALQDVTAHDTIALGANLTASITPSSGTSAGSTAVSITGTGANGGFQAAGGTLRVRFGTYPSSVIGYPADPSVAGAIIPTDFGVDISDWHPASSVVASSSTALTCASPVGKGSGKDVLVYLDGFAGPNVLAWFPAGYAFRAPTIISLSPTSGTSAGGTPVTITGTDLFNNNVGGATGTVTFNGVAATSIALVNSTTLTCVTPTNSVALVDVVFTPPPLSIGLNTYSYAASTLVHGYTYMASWWKPNTTLAALADCRVFNLGAPSDLVLEWTEFDLGVYYPVGTDIPWVAGSTPNPNGWYLTTGDAFTGSVIVVENSRPKDPRTWADIGVWATGDTKMLGGSPAASALFENRMVYPATGYTVGTDYPPIRVFEGRSDRELVRLPPTSSGGVPQAVLSMLTANGTVYVSSFDSGTSSTTWAGRVFSLDPTSGVMEPLGAAFTSGEMPYALAWHMGRLWCGTNNGVGTVGKVYYIRPSIDAAWTQDHSLATESLGGVDSLCSYKGQLYVGSDNASGSRGKVLVRSALGAYAVSETGSGGTAHVNNGYVAMRVFGGNLYAAYWNNDGTAIATIHKFDGSSWTTAYSGVSGTLRPFFLLFEDSGTLFAVGGSTGLTAALLSTPDGTTWTDVSAQLPTQASETLMPVYGIEVL